MKDKHLRRPTLSATLALLAALVGPPLFAVVPDQVFGEFPSLGIQVVLQLLYCGLAGFVVWVVLSRERLPLDSIGVRRPGWSTLARGALLWGVCFFVLPLMTEPVMEALGRDGLQAGIQKLALLPAWFRVIVGVTGGIVEEILYRGYAVERLATITGSAWIGGAISAAAFGLAHIPAWGIWFALGADLPFGIVMTLFYLWRRDLLANILAHSAGLVVAMLTTVP